MMQIPDEAALAAVKRYMRVEGTEEDAVISALYVAAVLYLQNAGIEPPDSPNGLYNLALWSLTLYYYDHRDDVGSETSFPVGLRPVITQLKLIPKGVPAGEATSDGRIP